MPKCYNLRLNSTTRLSGNRNNAIYAVNLSQLLPDDVEYWNVQMFFQSNAGLYFDDFDAQGTITEDRGCGVVVWNNIGKTLSLDNNGNCQNSVLGYIFRNVWNPVLTNATVYDATYNCNANTNPPVTIKRPTDSFIQISVYDARFFGLATQSFLVNSDADGVDLTDMTDYSMVLSFTEA